MIELEFIGNILEAADNLPYLWLNHSSTHLGLPQNAPVTLTPTPSSTWGGRGCLTTATLSGAQNPTLLYTLGSPGLPSTRLQPPPLLSLCKPLPAPPHPSLGTPMEGILGSQCYTRAAGQKQGVWKDELQRGLTRSLRFSSVSEGSPLRSGASRPGPRLPTSRTADQNQKGGWETG